MILDWPEDFDRWLSPSKKPAAPSRRSPSHRSRSSPSSTANPPRVRNVQARTTAKRHRLWRISHPYEPDIAIRIIFWFESRVLVIALVGFNKAKLGDLWYTSATVRAEALVDQWLRTHQPGTEGTP